MPRRRQTQDDPEPVEFVDTTEFENYMALLGDEGRQQQAYDHGRFDFARAVAADPDLAGWRLAGEVSLELWGGRSEEDWLSLTHPNLGGMSVAVRVAATKRGVAVTGVLVEREDRELSARDLRKLNLRPLTATALAGFRDYVSDGGSAPRSARPGRPGYSDEHWRQVRDLYLRARRTAPRRFIKTMREAYPEGERPSEATLRRWVKTVERKISEGEL